MNTDSRIDWRIRYHLITTLSAFGVRKIYNFQSAHISIRCPLVITLLFSIRNEIYDFIDIVGDIKMFALQHAS